MFLYLCRLISDKLMVVIILNAEQMAHERMEGNRASCSVLSIDKIKNVNGML